MEASKAFKLLTNHETIWAYLSSSTTRSEGGVCEITSMCYGPHAGFPRRATSGAEGREAVHRGDDEWSCPD